MSPELLDALRDLHSCVREAQNGLYTHTRRDQENVIRSAYELVDILEREIEL